VADASAFYRQLLDRLEREQALAPGALANLGTQRAEAIVKAMQATGVDAARVQGGKPEAVEAAVGKPVQLKLQLGVATR